MKNYPALMQSLDSLGKVENVTVQRQDRTGTQIDEANAPADISVQAYSQGNIVSQQGGPLATLRAPWRKGRRNHVECTHDWGRDCVLAPWIIAIVAIVGVAASREIGARRNREGRTASDAKAFHTKRPTTERLCKQIVIGKRKHPCSRGERIVIYSSPNEDDPNEI